MRRIRVGAWRDDSGGPMQVVSGAAGRERVHFEAPAAERLDSQMRDIPRLVQWKRRDRLGGEVRARPPLVCHYSPIR
jgi:hypothetical protein